MKQSSRIFSSCRTEILYPLNNSCPLPQPLVTMIPLSTSMKLTTLDTSYKWNQYTVIQESGIKWNQEYSSFAFHSCSYQSTVVSKKMLLLLTHCQKLSSSLTLNQKPESLTSLHLIMGSFYHLPSSQAE